MPRAAVRRRYNLKPYPGALDIMMLSSYHRDVRTTLTLDEDVWAKLRGEMRKSGRPFKEEVNHFLRLGLSTLRGKAPRAPFVVRARPLGTRPGVDYDNVAELLEQIEGATHP